MSLDRLNNLIKDSRKLDLADDKTQSDSCKKLFQYVNSIYSKIMKRGIYQEKIMSRNDCFVKMMHERDAQGCSQCVLPWKGYCKDPMFIKKISYSRAYILKKIIVIGIANILGGKKYQVLDLNLKPIRVLYENQQPQKEAKIKYQLASHSILATQRRRILIKNRSSFNIEASLIIKEIDISANMIWGETVWKCALITLKGFYSGNIMYNGSTMMFKSYVPTNSQEIKCPLQLSRDSCDVLKESIKEDDKCCYRLGPTSFLDKNKVIIWKSKDMKKLILKRYNLLRQAVEIYFRNSNSWLFLFYTQENAMNFMQKIKQSNVKAKVISDPVEYITSKKYVERWNRFEITNFDFLMKLNKYSSRTFEDYNQYPVFPWIQFYNNEALESRNFDFPIAVQSPENRKKAESTLTEVKMPFGNTEYQYQNGKHYLPGLGVLGYLLRLPPFTTEWTVFYNGE